MTREQLCRFRDRLEAMSFQAPVTHVYNPLSYALENHLAYWERYGKGPKRVVLVGMNPGPWGMAQTGVPFGEVAHVRDWLNLHEPIGQPAQVHPARPIQGLSCPRSEVSGKRMWGFLRARYGEPDNFFRHIFIANYCPLMFMEESGRNRTPDKLPKNEREPLLQACDEALAEALSALHPEVVIGVGKWAEERARAVVASLPSAPRPRVTAIPHPSPANPAANAGWGRELGALLDSLQL